MKYRNIFWEFETNELFEKQLASLKKKWRAFKVWLQAMARWKKHWDIFLPSWVLAKQYNINQSNIRRDRLFLVKEWYLKKAWDKIISVNKKTWWKFITNVYKSNSTALYNYYIAKLEWQKKQEEYFKDRELTVEEKKIVLENISDEVLDEWYTKDWREYAVTRFVVNGSTFKLNNSWKYKGKFYDVDNNSTVSLYQIFDRFKYPFDELCEYVLYAKSKLVNIF